MTARDEPVRGVGEGGRPREWPLPAAGDYQDLVERLPLIVYIDGPEPTAPSLYVSPQTTAMLGYTPEDWASDPDFFTSILHPDDCERVVTETAHMIATGERMESEYRIVRRDGSVAWVRDEGVLVRGEDGKPLCMQGYIVDITDLKRREAAQLEGEAIVDSSFDAIVGRTADGLVTSWNAAAERMFGYSEAEMLGRSVAALMPPAEAQAFAEINASLRLGHVLEPFEAVRLTKDGREVDVETSVSLIVSPSGEVFGVSSISRDISERKRSQAIATRQAQLLEFIATGAALPQVLDRVTRFVEESADEVTASIRLLEGRGNAEDAMTTVSEDGWSAPISATDGAFLGTLTLRYPEPRERGAGEVEIVALATQVAAIAIERARAQDAARDSEERYRDLFENANEPIATVTMDEDITEVNAAFERVLGYTREELIGTNLAGYMTADSQLTSLRETERKVSGESPGTTFEQEFLAKDGHSVILEVSSRVIEHGGRPTGVQGICRDVTERRRDELELRRLSALNRHMAMHDDLTGLPNRACFAQQVEHAISVAGQDGSQIAVLLMDLDRFKEINDTLGHRYGDLLLIELARRLQSVLRRSDTVARLGGDEFGILVRQLADSEGALDQALERLLAALEQPFLVDGLPLHIEASVGVARFPAHGRDVDALLQRADVAMYVAKETGTPHAMYTAEHDRHDTASLTLLSELPRALRNRELVVLYQPKLDLRSGQLAGVEALTSWQHPTRGLIGPAEFVPAAEKTGLIQPLTLYVLDEALGQVSRWESEGHRLDVAVNLSMRNLHDTKLPGHVAELLSKWKLPGDRLTVEITESAIVSDPPRTTDVIRRLKALGVGVSIDDFGTGYTSLAYLARLAITQLKVDRSFVLNMDTDADDAAIVRSIITLGHDLDLEVVAEGVESKATYDQLALLGCDAIQGYWLSRPLAPRELGAWLSRSDRLLGEEAA